MNKEKLIAVANHKLEQLRNLELDFQDFEEEIAFKPEDLQSFFDYAREANGDDFREYLEIMSERSKLNWTDARIDELAKGTAPSLKELHSYADAVGSYEPDYLIFVPIEADCETGCAIINIQGYPEFVFSLVNVFPNEEDAKRFVRENWCL